MKVFCMNDCDWMAGEDLKSCKAEYLKNYSGCAPDDEDAFDSPHVVPDAKMDTMKFHDEDGTVRTFREQLQKMISRGDKFPTFFASTEY